MDAIDALFEPRSVAVFGASEDRTAGGLLLRHLQQAGYGGHIVPINPELDDVFDLPCHSSLDAYGEPVDLALIASDATTIPAIVAACGAHRVPAAVIYSGGFSEIGDKGAALERQALRTARQLGVRILGPNSMGLVRPRHRLDAALARNPVAEGNLGLISQSGAICSAVLDWAQSRRVGFSAIVALGTGADIGFGEVLDYMAMDPATEAILMFVEGIRRTRRFMSGLRAAARLKPVIVLKAGRTEAGTRAALAHTGSLVGGYDVFEAALRRAGAVRVNTIGQLFAAASVLSRYRRVGGKRLTIVTNAGGPAVMATDRAIERGLTMSELSAATTGQLDDILPNHWPRANPVDILRDADAERYAAALAACAADPACDTLLVINAPTADSDPVQIAEAVVSAAGTIRKPILSCWLGEAYASEARHLFVAARIPTFTTPERAVDSVSYLAEYSESQKLLVQTPNAVEDPDLPDFDGARMILEGVLAAGRKALNERESKALLRAFRIPTIVSILARDPQEALVAAETVGFPLAMKIESPDIPFRSEVDGVRLDIESAGDVAQAFHSLRAALARHAPEARFDGIVVQPMIRRTHARELKVGVFRDPAFGPAIGFGAGGMGVELLADRSVGLPPLNAFLADQLVASSRVSRMLGGDRQRPPVGDGVIQQVLLRLSDLVCELPEVQTVDIEPLLADEAGAVAVDARITVKPAVREQRRYTHLAVHPYPVHYRYELTLRCGRQVVIRPIRPEDAAEESRFVLRLSERSRYFRFMNAVRELTDEMLIRFTQIDYGREMALLALLETDEGQRQIGVCRYVGDPDDRTCEFAVVVGDEVQGHGIGRELMRRLIEIARDQDFEQMTGEILAENESMLALARSLGFTIQPHMDDPALKLAVLPLRHRG